LEHLSADWYQEGDCTDTFLAYFVFYRVAEALRKTRVLRQVEAAELMATVGNFTKSYAKALLAATRHGIYMDEILLSRDHHHILVRTGADHPIRSRNYADCERFAH